MAKNKTNTPWVKGTEGGKLYLDWDHSEWIKYFTEFVMNPKNRVKIGK